MVRFYFVFYMKIKYTQINKYLYLLIKTNFDNTYFTNLFLGLFVPLNKTKDCNHLLKTDEINRGFYIKTFLEGG